MSEVDYQAVAEGLQRELEQARLEILRLRFSRSVKLDGKIITDFLAANYLTIAAIGLVLSVLFNFVDLMKHLKGEKHEG